MLQSTTPLQPPKHLVLFLVILPLLLQSIIVAQGAPSSDRVHSLPGYNAPLPAPQYSGFLNATAADPDAGVFLHYWFARKTPSSSEEEKEEDDNASPIVLWLNGGPGSSSILGMLQENGPLLINHKGDGLVKNPYAWTNLANLLILESPAGVGYSYCTASLQKQKDGKGCVNTDVSTARAARVALEDFFENKFPELRGREFFIAGESYAGVYVPTLAKEILDHSSASLINLKGVAVGDPCTDNDSQAESMNMMWYGHKHGFVTQDLFDTLTTKCGMTDPSFLSAGRWRKQGAHDVLEAVVPGNDNNDDEGGRRRLGSTISSPSSECILAERKYLMATSRGFSQTWKNAYINNLSLYGPASSLNIDQPGIMNNTATYMMREDVRAALHVHANHLHKPTTKRWPGPNEYWGYESNYAACNSYAKKGDKSMIQFYRKIAPRLRSTIVFNGDTDPCVTYEGTRTAIEKVGFGVLPGGSYRPWFFNSTAASMDFMKEKPSVYGPDLELQQNGAQFGGHVVNYEHDLMFVTVHGAGHMVPQFRPQAALKLLDCLLNGKEFAPILVADEFMGDMEDHVFDFWLDEWVENSRSKV